LLPPLTQLNTPYPSISYLARHLRRIGIPSRQRDLGLELALHLYSRAGLRAIFDSIDAAGPRTEAGWRALALRAQHESAVEPVIAFLQGRDRTIGPRILDTPMLPSGERLARADIGAFGPHAVDDAARHLATLYLADLADLVAAEVDPGFGLARYHAQIATGQASFDPLAERLARETILDTWIDALADSVEMGPALDRAGPLVGISVPFPGNLYAGLRLGRRLRARGAFVVMGGGYVNTELRYTREARLWDCVDALSFDDGEGPLVALWDWATGGPDFRHRLRTPDGDHDRARPNVPAETAAFYGDLPLDDYLQLIDGTNPAHRLWSDGRWNKITLAHGCYWKKCSFCDIRLPYIADYAPTPIDTLVDSVRELVRDTGQRGFHLVDEAAPPRAMRDFALELLRGGDCITWWGNIRFEEAFTPDLCRLLAASGLVAVTGGLEVASDRLLARMHKGVTVEQVARVCRAFSLSGVLTHAYLMYGFPTQTEDETLESLELVRQLFAAGVLKSAFWHRFVLTRHSGMFGHATAYGFALEGPTGAPELHFAANDVPHLDPLGVDHDRFDAPLARAVGAWMRDEGLHDRVDRWFDAPVAAPQPGTRIATALAVADAPPTTGRVVWLGGDVLEDDDALLVHGLDGPVRFRAGQAGNAALGELLQSARPDLPPLPWQEVFPHLDARARATLPALRQAGLVVV
jgi:hypothetical protein